MAVWLIVLVIGLPWIGGLTLWRVGDSRPQVQSRLAVIFACAGALASLALLAVPASTTAIRVALGSFGDIAFTPDGLGVFLSAVASVIGGLSVIFSLGYMRNEHQLSRYYALIFLFIGAMCGLVLTDSLLLLFFFWELVAVCSYALISFHNDDPKAVAGGIKAVVITGLGGIGLLIGTLIAYSYLGSYQISALMTNFNLIPPEALSVVAFGFLIAAASKSAQVPFHTWLPAAMEAPTPISALIHAATMVNAGVYLLARFYPAFSAVPGWTDIVITIGVVSALLAALMALVANDLKRILAYSTISQLGFMFYAVGIGGIFASQFHLLSHAIFKALLFLGAGAATYSVGTRDLRRMGGLGRRMPFVRNVFVIGALALCGVPILNGFWSKELILEAGMHNGPWWPYQGMLLGVFLTALYTVRTVWTAFYGEPRSDKSPATYDTPATMRVALAILAFGTVVSWLLAGPFSALLYKTLPFHRLEIGTTGQFINEVVSAPTTYVAIIAIAIAGLVWIIRRAWLSWMMELLQAPALIASSDFGFEWLNRRLYSLTQSAALNLQKLQTGQLNWNVAGLTFGLLIVLAILALGGVR